MPTALVPLAQGFEELEAITVITILRRAGVEVTVASLDRGVVKGGKGLTLVTDTFLDDAGKGSYDLIALPGGQPGTNNLKTDQRVLDLLKKQIGAGRICGALGSAPAVLAEAGLLAGKRATAMPNALTGPKAATITLMDALVVEDGLVITSKSAGTALDFALVLVSRLCGEAKRAEVEAKLYRL